MIFRNMKKHFLLTIACLLTGMTASAQQYQWKNVPIVGGGFVDGFILHPTNPDVRFCRTDMGGAYRWDAVNKEWIQMLDWVSLDNQNLQGVESVAIDPNNDQKVYLACGTYTIKTGSILKSNDGGRSFIEVKVPIAMGGNENGRGNGERMMVDPLNSRNIYFGTRLNGLWRSVDEGMTWKRVDTFPDVTEQTDFSNPQNRMNRGSGIIAVVFDKKEKKGNDAKNIFVAVSLKDRQSIFVSRDAGKSWKAVDNQPVGLRPTHMVMAADRKLYISYADSPGPSPMTDGALWAYDIKKNTWTDISPLKFDKGKKSGFGYAAVAVDAHHPQHIIVSTHGLGKKYGYGDEEMFRSTDGGKQWIPLFKHGYRYDHSKAPYTKMAPLHWMFDIEIDPCNADHAYFTTGFGGWETFNLSAGERQGDTILWSIATKGVEETVPLELYAPPTGASIVSGVGDYGGYTHFDITKPVPEGMHYAPYFGNTDGVTGAWNKPDVMVRVGVIFNHLFDIPPISYSEDGGRTWKPCANAPVEKAESGHIAVNADASVWIWTPRGALPSFSTDKGESWNTCQGLPKNIKVIADKVNPQRFYAVDVINKTLYTSIDAGRTFTSKPLNITLRTTEKKKRGDNRGGQDRIYAMPDREGDLWLAAYDGLYHLNADLQAVGAMPHVSTLYAFGFGKSRIEDGYPTLYIIGVVDGVYGFFRSDDSGNNWVRINDDNHQYGLVLHICGDMQEYGRVYVGTHGRGLVCGSLRQ